MKTAWPKLPDGSRQLLLCVSLFLLLGLFHLAFPTTVHADWGLDTIPPSTSISVQCSTGAAVGNGGTCAGDSATVTISCADDVGGSGCQTIYYYSGGGYIAYTAPYNVPSSIGSYTVYAFSVDNNFNQEDPQKTLAFSFTYYLTIWVYGDGDHNCTNDAGGIGSVGVSLNGYGTYYTNGSGYIQLVLPQGFYSTTYVGVAGWTLSPCNSADKSFSLGPNQTLYYYITPQYCISGYAYRDVDSSGGYTGGDTGLNGVTVTLSSGASTVTSGGGFYQFANIIYGTYTVTPTNPSGYKGVTPTSRSITTSQTSCNNGDGAYFVVLTYTITRYTYTDYNHSCTIDGSDAYYSGTSYPNLTANTYSIDAGAIPGGWTLSPCDSNPKNITTSGASDPPITYFYITPLYSISGIVYADYNHDCVANSDAYGSDVAAGGATLILAGPTPGGTTSDGSGYSFLNRLSGSYTLTVTAPAGWQISPCTPGYSAAAPTTVAAALVLPPSQTQHFYITPLYTISGNVFVDYNHNAVKDAQDDNYPSQTITLSQSAARDYISPNPKTTSSDGSGNYSYTNLLSGSYTVGLGTSPGYAAPAGYQVSLPVPNPRSVVLASGPYTASGDFGLTPLYIISGNVYTDKNKNQYYNPPTDTLYALGTSTISFTPQFSYSGFSPSPATTGTGVYTSGQILLSGTYTITYDGPPIGYALLYPSPATFSVTVGRLTKTPTCNTNSYHDATCEADGSIANLDFGITNSFVWGQCQGGDCVNLCGFVDPIPAALSTYASIPDATGNTGLIFSGDQPFNFCPGRQISGTCQDKSSPTQQIVGGTGYPETFSPVNATVVRTSYGYLSTTAAQSGITPTDLATVCTLSSCTLPPALPNGIYKANSSVTLVTSPLYTGTYTFPASKNFVILVNGDLTIQGNIKVPTTSTATFSVSGGIYVDKNVGVSDSSLTTSNIEGFYSADAGFYTGGNAGDCTLPKDKRLNVAGAIVTNGSLSGTCPTPPGNAMPGNPLAATGPGTGNQRDLCEDNLANPSFFIVQRPDFVLHAPEFVKHQNFLWQELAP